MWFSRYVARVLSAASAFPPPLPFRANGDGEIRTLDPLLARQVLSQLSYTPIIFPIPGAGLPFFRLPPYILFFCSGFPVTHPTFRKPAVVTHLTDLLSEWA